MKIIYYVEDGYISGSRPQHLNISDSDLADCETEEEKVKYIENEIQAHFEQNTSWSCDIRKYLSQTTAP